MLTTVALLKMSRPPPRRNHCISRPTPRHVSVYAARPRPQRRPKARFEAYAPKRMHFEAYAPKCLLLVDTAFTRRFGRRHVGMEQADPALLVVGHVVVGELVANRVRGSAVEPSTRPLLVKVNGVAPTKHVDLTSNCASLCPELVEHGLVAFVEGFPVPVPRACAKLEGPLLRVVDVDKGVPCIGVQPVLPTGLAKAGACVRVAPEAPSLSAAARLAEAYASASFLSTHAEAYATASFFSTALAQAVAYATACRFTFNFFLAVAYAAASFFLPGPLGGRRRRQTGSHHTDREGVTQVRPRRWS